MWTMARPRLVRALTGVDTDHLPEEKRRGMTIDLGFAQATLPDGSQLVFIDVPGHERLVRNMLAGVAASTWPCWWWPPTTGRCHRPASTWTSWPCWACRAWWWR
jgi:hypothetical protein